MRLYEFTPVAEPASAPVPVESSSSALDKGKFCAGSSAHGLFIVSTEGIFHVIYPKHSTGEHGRDGRRSRSD